MDSTVLAKIKGGLIVSCQALEDEPLHSPYIMQRMAVAAMWGGAVGIRANTVPDISKIKEEVDLPIIGILKRMYDGSEVYITPTMREVDELMEVKPDIIALDSTDRVHPNGQSLQEFFGEARKKYPDQLFMADCSTVEEGIRAVELGFDIVGTTMHGYTPYTKGSLLPDFDMIEEMVKRTGRPVIAEGGIWTPEQLKRILDCGVLAAVVGTAITRPMDITRRFTSVIQNK